MRARAQAPAGEVDLAKLLPAIRQAPRAVRVQAVVAGQIENFVKFPPRSKAASFNLQAVMRQLEEAQSSKGH